MVHQVLTNEKYIGNNLYNRTSTKLQTPRVVNKPTEWVIPLRGRSVASRWSNVLNPPQPWRTMTARAPRAGPQRSARTIVPPLRKSARTQPAT